MTTGATPQVETASAESSPTTVTPIAMPGRSGTRSHPNTSSQANGMPTTGQKFHPAAGPDRTGTPTLSASIGPW